MCSKSVTIKQQSVSAPPSPTSSSCSSGHILLVSMQKLRNPAFQRFGADLRKTLMITSVVKQARKFYQLGSDVPVNCGCVRDDSMFILPPPTVRDVDEDETVQQPVAEEETTDSSSSNEVAVATSTERQQSRKHALSPFRKNRGPKVSCIVPVDKNNSNTYKSSNQVLSPHHETVSNHSHRHHNSNGNDSSNHSHPTSGSQQMQHNSSNDYEQIGFNNNSPSLANSRIPQQDDNSHQQSQPRLHVALTPAVARYLQFHQASDDTPPIKKRRLAAFIPHEPNAICITATVC